MGTVVLAGAKTYTVDFSGDGLLNFAVTAPVEQVGARDEALVRTAGRSRRKRNGAADGSGGQGRDRQRHQHQRHRRGDERREVNGKIVLSGAGGGTLSGTLDASGKGAGETGGQVSVPGDTVTLAKGARIDVSGDAGGGTASSAAISAAGFAHARRQHVERRVDRAARASPAATAARSRCRSDGATRFDGAITAEGGAKGGNGGLSDFGEQLQFAGGIVNHQRAATVRPAHGCSIPSI